MPELWYGINRRCPASLPLSRARRQAGLCTDWKDSASKAVLNNPAG